MKNLNAIMTDMLAEAEKGAAIEKEVNTRLLSLHARIQGGARRQETGTKFNRTIWNA